MSSLPRGFEAAQDGDGYTYYYNLNTGESTYDVPGGGGESHLAAGAHQLTPAHHQHTHQHTPAHAHHHHATLTNPPLTN